MSTHTDDKRYQTELIAALRRRNVSGVRIGEIVAEIESHTVESGSPRSSRSDPRRSTPST